MARYARMTPARTGGQGAYGYGLSPFRMLDEVRRDMDEVFGSYLGALTGEEGQGQASGIRSSFVPEIDIDREGDRYLVSVEAAGVGPEDMSVEVEDGVLTISGEKREERQAEDGARRERRYGRFSRSIRLADDIDPDNISARHEHGVLTISLPKRALPEEQKKRIEIQAGQQDGGKQIEGSSSSDRSEGRDGSQDQSGDQASGDDAGKEG